MAKNYFKIFLTIVFSTLFFSCSTTSRLKLSITEPALVNIQGQENTVGIINRSLPYKQNETIHPVDNIVTMEERDINKDGANELILGLLNELAKNNTFSTIKIIEEYNLKTEGANVFPPQLSWETIAKISEKHKLNYIFELSFYDADTKIDHRRVSTEKANLVGIKTPVIEHQATVTTFVKNGWRIYDVKNKNIIDETGTNNVVTSIGRGFNTVTPKKAIMGQKKRVVEASNRFGADYALKILPHKARVSRDYYTKGTTNFEIAKRMVQTGNWDGAAKIWAKELNNSEPKIVGRACYNMAIINEINGNLDLAVDWASKSYSDYGDTMALRYLNALKKRVSKNQLLNPQNQ